MPQWLAAETRAPLIARSLARAVTDGVSGSTAIGLAYLDILITRQTRPADR
jgi:hypothetical protein